MFEITNSSLKTFQTCLMKYFLSYVMCIKPKKEKEAFFIGRNLHQQREYYYANGRINEEFISRLPPSKESAILKGMLNGFSKKYKTDEYSKYVPEKLFSIPLPHLNAVARGRKDAVILTHEKESLIEEIKTTSKDFETFEEQMDWDTQPLFYLWAHFMETKEVLDGVLFKVLRKPQIRIKKNESDSAFLDRLTAEYNDVDKYFKTFKVRKTIDDLKWFQDELECNIKDMSRERDLWPRNMQRCFDYYSTCPFMPLCQKKELDIGLINSCYCKKTAQHEELEEENV